MAVAVNLQLRDFHVYKGLDRVAVHEMWFVEIVTSIDPITWSRDNTDAAILASMPMTRGQAHPDPGLSNALCQGLTVTERVNMSTGPGAFVYVVYDSNRRFGGGYLTESTGQSGTQYPLQYPVWSRSDTGLWQLSWQTAPSLKRYAIRRVETRYIDATIPEETRTIIHRRVGQIYRFDGVPYVIETPYMARLPSNAGFIQYFFESTSLVQAVPAGTFPGQDKMLPHLQPLEDWLAPFGSAGGVPLDITKTDPDAFLAEEEDQLPFL